ncbi:L-fuconolactonase [Microbacterium azadirachtae]|uniref:L-fuconolactonase n=1 Tax=Microbacterium azadirachtae TaxID=582680 RepID=A0A1I6I5G3_9MICO|nr:amidohydrolase family protein [Microbacterium azadirachtae]SFR61943.1 L-fuconolactonase [Microbacterium azadirachtae]
MRIVDAHVHLWDVDALPLPWFREDLGLPRRALPEDLGTLLRATGTGAAIAVQAADSVAEAEWLADVAERDPLVRRAVLQYAPSPGAPLGRTATAPGPSTTGIRAAVPQFAPDLSDVAGLDVLAAAAGEAGLVVELLLRPEQLPGAAALARRHPATTFVLCHLGLGAAVPDAGWIRDLVTAAAAPNLHAKTSGVVHPSRSAAELRRILGAALDAFGAGRLLHGSDWPISARHTPYEAVAARIAEALPALSAADAEALWAGTAERLYRL